MGQHACVAGVGDRVLELPRVDLHLRRLALALDELAVALRVHVRVGGDVLAPPAHLGRVAEHAGREGVAELARVVSQVAVPDR